jgi:Na+-transporting methylmalonyl-CoA/oxaloacetate decarboxylase gamma subunit
MRIARFLAVLVLLTFGLSTVLRADDGDKAPVKAEKKEKKDAEKAAAKAEKEKAEKEKGDKVAKLEKKDEHRGGNKFVNFWVHTVGGTIGNGLKTGAHKISNAFD